MIVSHSGPFIGFERLKEYRTLKAQMHKLCASDEPYYRILAKFGLEHADGITSQDMDSKLFAALMLEKNALEWTAPIEPPAPKVRRKLMPFVYADQFDDMRQHLNWLTGNDDVFNGILRFHGYESVDQIRDTRDSLPPYKAMVAERNRLQMERGIGPIDIEMRETLERAKEAIGSAYFAEILGRDFACASIDEAVQLDGEQTRLLLARLKQEVDERRTQ